MQVEQVSRDQIQEQALDWINSHLEECNIMASVFANNTPVDWFLASNSDTVHGVAIYDPARKELLLPRLEKSVISLLVPHISNIDAVNGEKNTCIEFATNYSQVNPLKFDIKQDLVLYVLDKQDFNPRISHGRVSTNLTVDVIDQAVELRLAFEQQFKLPPRTYQQTRDQLQQMLEQKEAFAWVDKIDGKDTVVSIAGYRKNNSKNMYRIGFVYTLETARKKGYASSVVSHSVMQCFQEGCNQVMLHADTMNPISNSVYQKLGFKQTQTAAQIEFKNKNTYL